jgi:hypothetical protein
MIKNFRTYRKWFVYPFALLAVFVTLISVSSSNAKPFEVQETVGNRSSYYGSMSAYINKCGPIYAYKNLNSLSMQIPDDFIGDVPSSPTAIPMYGYVSKEHIPLENIGFYSTKDTINRNWSEAYIMSTMWHLGTIVIWYDEDAAKDGDLEALKTLSEGSNNKLLVLPWLKYDESEIPRDRVFAFAMNGVSQTCETLDFVVFSEFVRFVLDNKIGQGLKPLSKAQLESDGSLPDVNPEADS